MVKLTYVEEALQQPAQALLKPRQQPRSVIQGNNQRQYRHGNHEPMTKIQLDIRN